MLRKIGQFNFSTVVIIKAYRVYSWVRLSMTFLSNSLPSTFQTMRDSYQGGSRLVSTNLIFLCPMIKTCGCLQQLGSITKF